MAQEIVTLKVTTEGDQAALQNLTKIDQLISKINGQKVNVNLAQGMKSAEGSAQAAAKYINAQANMLRAQNQIAAEAERTRRAIAGQATQEIKAQMAADGLVQTQQKYNLLWNALVYKIIGAFQQNIRKATDELKAMNAEMVSIQKVTGATDTEMERLKNQAFEVAGALGSTPSDYLSSATKWAQAGYKGLSDQLGELSAKTQVVGDVNEETANKFLLAVDAAYKYKGNIDALTRVLDGANEISNNYATSVEKLAGGMGIVSSLAEQAGMKVEETMAAIGTITAKTQESGNSAARALRALILNIQGSTEIEIDTETGERWSEDEIQRTAAALGNLNVATREYKNGIMELRNPMDVIGELAEKYQKGLVTEAQLQEVVASLGGKVRSNQLMALIQGFDTYLDMIETYKDAVGSADKELEIYLNGWEAKSNRLVNQWTQFVESFKASDISMGLLDIGNTLLEIANTDLGNPIAQVVVLTTALTALRGVVVGIKGEGIRKGIASSFAVDFTSLAEASVKAGGGVRGLAAALKTLAATPVGKIGLIVAGITALAAIADAATVTAKEQAQAAADAAAEYEQEKAVLEGLEDQLKTTQDRIDELNAKGGRLTVVEKEELEKLKEQNRDLEWQITLQEKLAEAKKQAAKTETNNALNKGYTGADYNYRPWRDSMTGTRPLTTDELEYDLGRLQGFENQGKYLIKMLDDLNEKKQKFLSDNGEDAGKWSEGTAEDFRKIKNEIETVEGVAIAFYDELYGHMENLPEADQGPWRNLAVALREAIDPSKALTDRLNEIVDAMDEAEKTKFHEMLSRLQKDGKVTAQEVQVLLDQFPVLKQLLDMNGVSLETLAQHLTESAAAAQEAETGIEGVGGAARESQEKLEDLDAKLREAVSGMEAMRDAQDELAANGKLSTNTVLALLGKYSDALDQVLLKHTAGIATQEEVNAALEKAYQEDLDNYRNAILEKEMDSEDFYASWLAANSDTVEKLAKEYGVDASQYKTFAQLKTAIEQGAQTAQTDAAAQGKIDRIKIFQDIQTAFENTQTAMVDKAKNATGIISSLYGTLVGLIGGFAKGLSGLAGTVVGAVSGKMAEEAVMNSISAPSLGGGKTSSGKSGGGKDWYETQTDNLKSLIEQTKRTNQVLEKSDQDTAQKRIDNLRKMQDKVLAAQKQFIARGKDAASDEVNQLKIMYAELGDEIKSIYSSMTDSVLEQHDYLIWAFEKKANNRRAAEQIAADDAAMVSEYRKMQDEVHKLAEYYRSQGVRENDKLIRDLQDKWWEYEKAIRSMYDNLTDAFNDYIDESSHKIEELGRATGNVGKQIEIYAQRIQRAQETIAALQANNINGENNGKIFDLESQIWGDKDAIRDLQESLWDELERAFDDIFDKAQEDIDAIGDEIDAIQDQMDEINEVLEQYDKELEGVLKPINDTLEKLNDQLEAERKRLEALTDPLNERKDALEDQIKGYYTLNPDGSIGPYIKGLDDEIGEIQDQIDKANEELDRVNDAWNEQKNREEEALALQKKQLAVEEAQKAVEEAMLALQTARNERNVYTLKDGVWAWRADEEAVAKAEKALADAEKAKEEAEKDLQDYKEEQAHKQIVKRLEEQIKALEEQKKLLDKQKDLINKQIEAISKQIAAYEKESSARQELIQDLIDRNEAEKKAWQDHYQALKEQYSQQLEYLEAEKKAAEERKKQAQEQYDGWMDTWKDIQKSIETPARDLSEILNDIAKYGTPAMADQVDRVTDLLRQLGYVLDDVTSGGGYNPDGGGSEGMTRREIIDQMLANSRAYPNASKAEQDRLFQENQRLGAMIGANWDPNTYTWDIFEYGNGTVTVRPGAYEDDFEGYSISRPDYMRSTAALMDAVANDGYEEKKAQYGIISSTDYMTRPASMLPPEAGDTVYNDDHRVIMNGVTIGSSMMQRPLSETLSLISLHMGT